MINFDQLSLVQVEAQLDCLSSVMVDEARIHQEEEVSVLQQEADIGILLLFGYNQHKALSIAGLRVDFPKGNGKFHRSL